MIKNKSKLLFEGSEWDFDKLNRTHDAIEEIALNDLGLNVYPNQMEIISSEQMLDAYSSVGLPRMYQHWSFGKRFARDETHYRKGLRGLAYEIVINSNPCISYNMEENTMALQTLVIAHAAFGHNHFFKNNSLFQEWTDAESILDYLEYVCGFMHKCEEKYGVAEVEKVLDAAHALQTHGVFKYRRKTKFLRQEKAEEDARYKAWEQGLHYLDGHVQPAIDKPMPREEKDPFGMKLPEENLLYFLERHSPILKPWQREVLRIVRNLAQYFYPQMQTKVMNEGCACFVHYHILNKLWETGQIDDGAMLEVLHSHTNVVTQPDFDDPRFSGFNPYALGFAMMQDIKRICTDATDEDREWFPEIANCGDWRNVLKEAWASHRDESFITQFLSPKVMRDFRMFSISDNNEPWVVVEDIHNDTGYHDIRAKLALQHTPSISIPNIQVTDAEMMGDRSLWLYYDSVNDIPLDEKTKDMTTEYCRRLWGYDVYLEDGS